MEDIKFIKKFVELVDAGAQIKEFKREFGMNHIGFRAHLSMIDEYREIIKNTTCSCDKKKCCGETDSIFIDVAQEQVEYSEFVDYKVAEDEQPVEEEPEDVAEEEEEEEEEFFDLEEEEYESDS